MRAITYNKIFFEGRYAAYPLTYTEVFERMYAASIAVFDEELVTLIEMELIHE